MTRYAIRRKADGLFWIGRTKGSALTIWAGSPALDRTFEFMTIAWAVLLFEVDEPIETLDVVPIQVAA